MLPLNFGAPTGNPVYTKQELNSFLPNPNVTGLLGPALNFNAPQNNVVSQYATQTYTPQAWNYNQLNDFQGMLKQLAQQNPDQGIWRLFSLVPNNEWKKTG